MSRKGIGDQASAMLKFYQNYSLLLSALSKLPAGLAGFEARAVVVPGEVLGHGNSESSRRAKPRKLRNAKEENALLDLLVFRQGLVNAT